MEDTTLLQPELERHYKPLTSCSIDYNMLFYGQEENGSAIDWNKLIYNEEQLQEFTLRKQEKIFRPEFYEYLFSAPAERTEMEKFFLTQSGFSIDENEDEDEDEEMEQPIRRFVIDPSLYAKDQDPNDAK